MEAIIRSVEMVRSLGGIGLVHKISRGISKDIRRDISRSSQLPVSQERVEL